MSEKQQYAWISRDLYLKALAQQTDKQKRARMKILGFAAMYGKNVGLIYIPLELLPDGFLS